MMQMSFVNCDLVPMLGTVGTNSRDCNECEQQEQARELTFVLNLKWIFNHFQVPQRKCTHLFTIIILTEECI